VGVRRRSPYAAALLTALALLTAGAVSAAPLAPHDGLIAVTADPASDDQVAAIWRLAEHVLGPHDPAPRPHALLVTRRTAALLREQGIALRPEDSPAPVATAAALATTPGQLGIFDGWWSQVRDLEAIHDRLDELERFARGRARVLTLGRSVEGRPIKALRILAGDEAVAEARAAILITGTHHAREWASPMVTMGIAEALVRQYLPDLRARRVANTLAVYVVPVVNVDGYVATHRGQRLQRKNMNPRCPVDLNRNYDVAFGLGAPVGGCAEESYPGPHPFSEPETRAIRDLYQALPNLRLFLDYHAPAEQVMIPFAHTRARPHDFEQSRARAERYAATLRSLYGTLHPAREGFDLAQGQGGGAIDWFRVNGRESFAVELRDGRDLAGFELPPEQLVPSAEENWTAFLELALSIALEHPLPGGPDPEEIVGDGTESIAPPSPIGAPGCHMAPTGAAPALAPAAPLVLLAALACRRRRR
jgi:predicted deacylase